MLIEKLLQVGVHQDQLHRVGLQHRIDEGPVAIKIKTDLVHLHEPAIILLRCGHIAQIHISPLTVRIVRLETSSFAA